MDLPSISPFQSGKKLKIRELYLAACLIYSMTVMPKNREIAYTSEVCFIKTKVSREEMAAECFHLSPKITVVLYSPCGRVLYP